MRRIYCLIGCVLLSACGDSGSSSPVTVPTIPTLVVTLTPSAKSQTVTEADTVTEFTVQAAFSGSSVDPIYPRFDYDSALLTLDGPIELSGNGYRAKFKSNSGLSANNHKSPVTFRLCRDSNCGTVYPGSVQAFDYTLDVKLGDWATRQRNAAHNGYVHAVFDPANFAKAWDYAPAGATKFDPVAARQGTVFITQGNSDGSSIAIALDGLTGVERWRYSLGNVSDASGPALSGDQLIINTMSFSSGTNPTVMLNATSGLFFRHFITAAQWSTFAQPTPFQDLVYMASGYYGNVVYAHDVNTAAAVWETYGSAGNTWDGEAPAVDSRYLYYYSGNLDVMDRLTGVLVKSIDDPFWQWNGYSYGGTPMIGSDNHVIAYSGNGMGTYSISFPLVNYDIQAGTYRWRTASAYTVIPAVAKGVIYAASNQISELDAIDEATGKALWAWPLPNGEQFLGNIVVTDTLVFVSTDKATYAIDLQGTHQTKWSDRTSGWLAITPDAKLIVTPSTGQMPARITAFSLQ
jgi:outer membrane protein assembly factor BamB